MHLDSDLAVGEFVPPLGLRHRHLQSMLPGWALRARILSKSAAPLLQASTPELLECDGGVRLLGYYSGQTGPASGLAIFLHGWEGCADSSYVVSAGAALYEAGFDIFRLNFRDHGNTHALNVDLFHSCRIDEVVDAIRLIVARHPAPRSILVGHSLGGNFALRAATRSGLGLDRVIAICPVLKPHSTMQALEEGLWVYRHYFLRRWRRSLLAKASSFPERYDFGDLRRFPTLTATTDFFVKQYTEFQDLDSYLRGYSITGRVLSDLSVPARLIVSVDDPVIPVSDLPDLARHEALSITISERGGHCGFLDGYGLKSWLDQALVRALAPAR